MFTTDQIAEVTGAPLANVNASWASLISAGLPTREIQIAAIATVYVECGRPFLPISEMGGADYFNKLYGGRADLGNTEPGDGAHYRGRGFIQITGRFNYRHFGSIVGADLEANPMLALDSDIAAKVLVAFFRERDIFPNASMGNWVTVRKRVNGGANGLNTFLDIVNALEKLP